jgi:myosin-5
MKRHSIRQPPNVARSHISFLFFPRAGVRVWLKDKEGGWVKAIVQRKQGNSFVVLEEVEESEVWHRVDVLMTLSRSLFFSSFTTVTSRHIHTQEKVVPSSDLLLQNPDILEGVDDMTTLSYLHEPAILENLETSMKKKEEEERREKERKRDERKRV